jgi:hypothetical protein
MANLQKALRALTLDDCTPALPGHSTMFLQQFVRAYCAVRAACPKARAGECPLDMHAGGIGDLMAELDRVGQMLNAVDATLTQVSHYAESSSRS